MCIVILLTLQVTNTFATEPPDQGWFEVKMCLYWFYKFAWFTYFYMMIANDNIMDFLSLFS